MTDRSHATRASASPASPARVTAPPARVAPVIRQLLHAPVPQPKLTVGAPNDAFEREADRVADQVMRMPEPGVQRVCAGCEEEEEARGTVQRMCAECAAEEEEEKVRAKAVPGARASLPAAFESRFAALHGGGQPLPAGERSFFEPRFGRDFSSVRVHTSPAAGELARAVNARAFTLGDSLVFGPGEYAPGTTGGRSLLAHELTHVVQQGGSGAGGTIQRAVRFQADFSNISLTSSAAAAISGQSFTYQDAAFSADGDITATGDTAAELNDWDVGFLQDMVVNWEREYWSRNNADGRGRFVEQKFRLINTRFRDQVSGAASVWYADSAHQLLSGLAPTAAGSQFEVSTTISTSDSPGGSDRRDGEDVPGMDASDGERNIRTQRIGSRFDTWISAHNTVTDEWRHLRRLNWNYMRSLDFTGSGATLAVGPESGQVGRHGPYGAGKGSPLTSGTTANTAVNDAASWRRRRVNGWT